MCINLDIFRVVISRVGVDVVRAQILAVTEPSYCWLCVGITVSVKSRFAEVRGISTIWQQSACEFEFLYFLLYVFALILCHLTLSISSP